MLGAIIGDIVGSAYEFNPTNDYNFEMFAEGCLKLSKVPKWNMMRIVIISLSDILAARLRRPLPSELRKRHIFNIFFIFLAKFIRSIENFYNFLLIIMGVSLHKTL